MNGDPLLYDYFNQLAIEFEYIEHPAAPTIEIAKQYWGNHDATHCKNIFLRNHKGNQHYLILLPCDYNVNIRHLELKLKQGKLSFSSPERLFRYLQLTPGSVTPYGLIHDVENHVIVYLDHSLSMAERLSFHPNINTASIIVKNVDFMRFLESTKNRYEFVDLVVD